MGGRGKAFCAGLDIKSASDPSVPRPFGAGMGFSGCCEVYVKMRRCPQPIISMIQDRPVVVVLPLPWPAMFVLLRIRRK